MKENDKKKIMLCKKVRSFTMKILTIGKNVSDI